MSSTQKKFLTLVSHNLCPYVQRAVIVLEEQGVRYKRIDIDLDNAPEWFRRLSPLGKVPLLVVDDDIVLFESAVIAEYINETGSGDLLSSDLLEKARQRAWIEFASVTLDNIGQLYSAAGEKKFKSAEGQLEARWQQLEQAITGTDYFVGDDFSLVDAAFAPVFRYLDLFEQLLDIEFLQRYPKVASWRQLLVRRGSVKNAVGADYQQLLAEFVAERKSYLGKLARIYLVKRKAA